MVRGCARVGGVGAQPEADLLLLEVALSFGFVDAAILLICSVKRSGKGNMLPLLANGR